MEKKTDVELVKLYRSGNERAFEVLYERYSRLISSLANVFYFFESERGDLKQEGLLGLLSAVNHYDENAEGAASFSTFAYACIRNKIRNAAKGKSAEQKKNEAKNLPIDGFIGLEDLPMIPPDDDLIDKENFIEAVDSLKKVLSPYEIKVFELYLKGENYLEIAEALDKTPKSVDNTLQRIKDKAKKL